MAKKFDFSGWATRANMLCSDGRTIMKDAFKECDGVTVPLVWNHQHNSVEEVLGHALLENREDGVYAYGTFNDTPSGQNAKLLVQNGDVNRLSIYANKLKQQGGNVVHGVIRELSLVLAGANPGAYIESVMMHGEDSYEEGYICPDEYIENVEPLFHADTAKKGEKEMAEETKKTTNAENEETVKDVFETLSEKQKKAVYAMFGMLLEETKNEKDTKPSDKEEKKIEHAEKTENSDKKDEEEIVEDVFNTLSEKQKTVVYALIGQALEEAGVDDDEEDEKEVKPNKGGNTTMKHNVFEQDATNEDMDVLTHSEMKEIFEDAKRNGSLADTVLQHGITNIDYLFPDAQNIDKEPGFIKRPDDWVSVVMNAVHKTPFSRIKSIFADITADEARAKGYIKGNQKVDEVFTLLKRTTTPTTVYKKQKLDRDDVVDITDFDVVAWLKKEMRMMLDEEIARAILVGDGRNSSSNDKINEQNIRPIWTDDDVYTVKSEVAVTNSTTDDEKAKAFIKAAIKSRKEYKGSGTPDMFMSEDMLTNCLLLEDKNGRVIYDSVDKLATALRVRKIISVPVMEDLKREKGSKTYTLAGIYVNLVDYNIGADKGGAVNMFDDFDIDYNAMKYLIETRCSGALIKPYSAVAIEFVEGE
nr:MAG TPA: major capsid protein [Caudoviricetes sp.]